MQPARNSLKLVACPHCTAKVFISGSLSPLEKTPCSKCGKSIMMPMQLRQFELQSEIASGGMGTVFRSFDTTLGRVVAVKLPEREPSRTWDADLPPAPRLGKKVSAVDALLEERRSGR